MNERKIRVLLVGESRRSFHHLAERLEQRQCRCLTATSYAEARRMLTGEMADIVLSVIPRQEISVAEMTKLLSGSRASFFYGHPVEDGRWWLPALRRGERCLGAPALRPGEFAAELDALLKEIAQERVAVRQVAARASGLAAPTGIHSGQNEVHRPNFPPQQKFTG